MEVQFITGLVVVELQKRKKTLTPPPKFKPSFSKPRIEIEFVSLGV
jgi:hypothetical protein